VQLSANRASLINAAAELASQAANASMPVVFCPPIATFRDRRATADNLVEGLTLSVDCDACPAKARAKLEDLLGTATMIVASGGEWIDPATGKPQDKLHLHWRLAVPTRTREEHANLKIARRLAQMIASADATSVPPVHPLRWPGSWHRKGQPRLARIVGGDPEREIVLSEILMILRDELGAIDESEHRKGEPQAPIDRIEAAVRMLPNADRPWEEWNRYGMAIFAASGGSEEGRRLFKEFSSKSAKYNEARTEERWEHYQNYPPSRIGAGTLFYAAAAEGVDPDIDLDYASENTPKPNGAADEPGDAEIHDAGDIFQLVIPPRGWLLSTVFCKQFVSALVGTGATGKTALRIVQALALASGRPITGEHVHRRAKVLFLCFEDGIAELRRRIKAAMIHHKIKPEEVRGHLFYNTINGAGSKLLKTGPRGAYVEGPLEGWLRRQVSSLGIDLIIFDPFIKTHGVDENDNAGIDQVVTILARLAIEMDIAADYAHHTRKGSAAPGDAEAGRGASAAKDAGRLVYTLSPMGDDAADMYNIDRQSRRALVRMDSAKVNIAPPLADAIWFKLVGVPLGNSTDRYPNGDTVQTCERWYPPDMWTALTDDIVDTILDKIESGPGDGQRYSPAPQQGDRAGWALVIEMCPSLSEKQAKEAIKQWVNNGVLAVRRHIDPTIRKEKPGLFVGKRPARQETAAF
jgi:hypothetical protein